jgi:hypothetical protein
METFEALLKPFPAVLWAELRVGLESPKLLLRSVKPNMTLSSSRNGRSQESRSSRSNGLELRPIRYVLFSSDSYYLNYLGEESEDTIKAAFGPNYERLMVVKKKYDPENFFSLNQNIKPRA